MLNDYINYNDNRKHKVLIVDDVASIHLIMKRMLEKNNYYDIHANDGKEAIEIINNDNIDIIISDIEMPEVDGFELINYINQNNIKIPYIMMTTLDTYKYIDTAIQYNVGNILSKPLKENEVLGIIYKIITRQNIFGLDKYINRASRINCIDITSSEQIKENVEKIMEYSVEGDVPEELSLNLKIILYEIVSNAVYHAYGKSDLKEKHEHFTLPAGEKVEIKYGFNESKFGIGITDFKGSLKKHTILSNIKDILDAERKLQKAFEKGESPDIEMKEHGRGIYMSVNMSSEYYINIQVGIKTEIIFIIEYTENTSVANPKISLKINEFY